MATSGYGKDFVYNPLSWLIAAIFSIASLVISGHAMYMHLRIYTKPDFQRYIVRILMIVPFYSIFSFLCLVAPKEALYFEAVRDIYEAYVIYCFLVLMLKYCGGDSNCIARISISPGDMYHPIPFCCLPKIRTDSRFLRWCKQGTLQFVVVKPVCAILSLIMMGLDLYESTYYQAFLITVYNLSYTIALYMLFLFYWATRNILKPFNPVRKFFAVKTIVFLTYWQSLAVSFIPNMTKTDALLWNDLILCIEMFFFALMTALAFTYKEWMDGECLTSIFNNVANVLSVRDVMQDAYNNFNPKYKDYTLQHHEERVDVPEPPDQVVKSPINMPWNRKKDGLIAAYDEEVTVDLEAGTTTVDVVGGPSAPGPRGHHDFDNVALGEKLDESVLDTSADHTHR